MSTLVYSFGGPLSRIHSSPDCPGIRRSNKSETIRQFEFAQLPNKRLCLHCFPDAPTLRSVHTLCCTKTNVTPCKHNGGVLVYNAKDPFRPLRWVWPEDAHKYSLVNPIQLN